MLLHDSDGDGFLADEDCNDGDSGIHPETEEICDGIDNNCNGFFDEGELVVFFLQMVITMALAIQILVQKHVKHQVGSSKTIPIAMMDLIRPIQIEKSFVMVWIIIVMVKLMKM